MKKLLALLLALTMCLTLAACGASAPENETAPASAEQPVETAPAEEPFNNQKIRIGDNVYDRFLRGLMEQTASEVTVVLESDVLMTGSAIILGSSDYGGMFPESIALATTNVTLDLNGFSITGEEGMPVFEVQSGYTLTVVDSSPEKTGKLITRGDVEVLVDGGTYHPLDS